MTADRLIVVGAGDAQIDVRLAWAAETQAISGREVRNLAKAFTRPQEAIVQVAKSTAWIIVQAWKTAALGLVSADPVFVCLPVERK